MSIWLFKGSARNVAYSILYYYDKGVFIWGLNRGNREVFDSLKKGDRVYLYVMSPLKVVIVRGVVADKSDKNSEKFWPEDSKYKDNWPLRFVVDVDWCGVPKDRLELVKRCVDIGDCEALRVYGVNREDIEKRVSQKSVLTKVFGRGSAVNLSFPELLQVAEVIDSLISEKSRASEGGRHMGYDSDRLLTPSVEFERYLGFGAREDAVLYIYGRVLIGLASRGVASVEKSVVEGVVDGVLKELSVADKFGERLSQVKAFVYNDFRRVGVLSVGGGGDWRGDVAASLTDLGMQLFSFVDRLGRVEGFGERDLAVFVGSLPIVLCLSRLCSRCVEGEAGVCLNLYNRREIRDGATRRLVDRAVEVVRSFWGLFLVCMPYGVDVRALVGYGGQGPSSQ